MDPQLHHSSTMRGLFGVADQGVSDERSDPNSSMINIIRTIIPYTPGQEYNEIDDVRAENWTSNYD